MKTQQNWFDEYAISHQNEVNQKIHYICVPAIFFSIVGIVASIPNHFIHDTLHFQNAVFGNWASIALILTLIFYARMSLKTFTLMSIFSFICLYGNYYIGTLAPLLWVSLSLFVIAWIGQFYGHQIEGKKPSFLKDLQFLLIGPAWVFEKMTRK